MGLLDIQGARIDCLDHGFVRVVDAMGEDTAIVQAARVSYGAGTKTPSDDRSLIRYLMRHEHTTPFEMVEIKLHVKMPIFVARQWLRHRTANVNEVSARYSVLPGEFYVPGEIAYQSEFNGQGRSGPMPRLVADFLRTEMAEDMQRAADHYAKNVAEKGHAGEGMARETARIALPLGTYTEFYWKIDGHNLLHFLRLRMDAHAQEEIRVYAFAIAKIVAAWLPKTWEAFEDYRLNAHTFSGPEMQVLRRMIDYYWGGFSTKDPFEVFLAKNVEVHGDKEKIGKREVAAFLEALR